ncbi:MAG: hypothetical protein COV91_02680 [Candidatus Taylorbacteria bacterium CG11_big_fil_rev_8_21_14_0_20_46_11]|uniref:Transposase n=1 Tax=Candidatus Taylorbacteria bacterium CG11_big_fil_rev_8_21_14_0_20_46_11 TaxID=1975025 RepID=A0A2H0KE65_9BACT|nr:MAG: hypothetical protein COV91_02680 [Candidatus Taylorbacteria bacterium CG11_big_fil_rev_8_21_14_0_20_46_11]
MKFKPKPHEQQEVPLTLKGRLQVIDGDVVHQHTVEVLQALHTDMGVGVQKVLSYLQTCLSIESDDAGVVRVDLVFPCPEGFQGRDREKDARKLLAQPVKEKKGKDGKPLPPRVLAEPRYTNEYRLVAVEKCEAGEKPNLRFRLFERYTYAVESGKEKKQTIRMAHTCVPANTFHALLQSWMRVSLDFLSKPFRGGVLRKCAEQINSYIELLAKGEKQKPSFPSISERDPTVKKATWLSALERVAKNTDGFSYQTARELYPAEYTEDDPKGKRLINVDHDWRIVMAGPTPGRFPAFTTLSNSVVVFRREYEKGRRRRYYAMIPVFEGVSPESVMGMRMNEPRHFWWQKHREEFHALKAWTDAVLPVGNTAVVIPISYSRQNSATKRLETLLENGEWQVRIASISETHLPEKHIRHSNEKRMWKQVDAGGKEGAQQVWRNPSKKLPSSRTEWWLKLSLAKVVEPVLRDNVLGIHFETDDVIRWCVMNRQKEILDTGVLEGNPILDAGLQGQARHEGEQRRYRNTKGRGSADELKRKTYEVTRSVLELLEVFNANLAFESISWVEKGGPDSTQNKKFSLWNFSALPATLRWLALREIDPAVPTVSETPDFRTEHTCPKCGACRRSGQTRENADTVRNNDSLLCRKCDFNDVISPEAKAHLVTSEGVDRAEALRK